MKPAFGAVSMLLALVIVAIIAIMMIPVFKSTVSSPLKESSLKKESVEEQVDELVKEIETRKQEALQYYNNVPE